VSKQYFLFIKFEILTVVRMSMLVFWVVMSCKVRAQKAKVC
jgi:hypothetical protein